MVMGVVAVTWLLLLLLSLLLLLRLPSNAMGIFKFLGCRVFCFGNNDNNSTCVIVIVVVGAGGIKNDASKDLYRRVMACWSWVSVAIASEY